MDFYKKFEDNEKTNYDETSTLYKEPELYYEKDLGVNKNY
jgi:hypothetical protein